MNNKGNLTDQRPPLLPLIIGTGLGSGLWPWGPGTAGSIAATVVWLATAYWSGLYGIQFTLLTLGAVLLFTILGTWATHRLQPYWGEDPSRVVIDEWVGVWIPLSLLWPYAPAGVPTHSLLWVLAALILFRFFDMVKPFGIKKLDQKSGAFYVMLDDIVAGIYAALVLLALQVIYAFIVPPVIKYLIAAWVE